MVMVYGMRNKDMIFGVTSFLQTDYDKLRNLGMEPETALSEARVRCYVQDYDKIPITEDIHDWAEITFFAGNGFKIVPGYFGDDQLAMVSPYQDRVFFVGLWKEGEQPTNRITCTLEESDYFALMCDKGNGEIETLFSSKSQYRESSKIKQYLSIGYYIRGQMQKHPKNPQEVVALKVLGEEMWMSWKRWCSHLTTTDHILGTDPERGVTLTLHFGDNCLHIYGQKYRTDTDDPFAKSFGITDTVKESKLLVLEDGVNERRHLIDLDNHLSLSTITGVAADKYFALLSIVGVWALGK